MIVPRIKPITNKRIQQLKRNSGAKEYQDWRKYVMERDGNICQYPRCFSEKDLQVHHIKKFSLYKHLKTDKLNGITLCKVCHGRIYNREEMFELLFLNIVLSNEKKFRSENN